MVAKTAEEMREISWQSEAKIAEVEAQPLLKFIREAAEQGEFSIDMENITPRVQRYLDGLGYNFHKNESNQLTVDWYPRPPFSER